MSLLTWCLFWFSVRNASWPISSEHRYTEKFEWYQLVCMHGPSGQNLAASTGNLRGLWLLVEGIHMEIWVVSETKIKAEIQGNFQIGVKMRGKFPQTCKHFNSPNNGIKSSLVYFHTTGPFLCHYIVFWNFEGNLRKISRWKYPQGFHRERRWKYPHRTFPFISSTFPLGNYEEVSTGMIPWTSPTNPRGNLWNLGDAGGFLIDLGSVVWRQVSHHWKNA